MQNYRYRLQPKNIKLTCPSCGQKRCFKPYIDTATGAAVGDGCGRCDHEHSCGYHLTPSQYFAQHPDQRTSSQYKPMVLPEEPKVCPIGTIPAEWLLKSRSTASVLYRWMAGLTDDSDALHRTYERYLMGATSKGEVIYWQVDIHGRARAGKIMAYTTDGHRKGNPSWVHTRLQNRGLLPGDWNLQQCLFGEHLLAIEDHPAVLVESEKTALLGDLFFPQYTWLATGGCKGLRPEKMEPLVGRRVIVLPDSGCYESWQKVLMGCPGLSYTISDALESYPPNTDIADLLVADLVGQPKTVDDTECPY